MAEPAEEPNQPDLGLSGRIAQSRQKRIMRPDGTFDVVRLNHGFWESINVYQHMVTVSWPRFFLYVFIFYVIANAMFATLYIAAGPGAIQGGEPGAAWHNAIFFSVQTIATIGYGQMTPKGTMANSLVAIEALSGLMGFALITGILFARFSRPSAHIIRSNVALIAPYKDITAFMFRIANGRQSQLLDLRVTVTYSWMGVSETHRPIRRFRQLPLERDTVGLLPTQWVIVHPIDAKSPFYGCNQAEVLGADPEIFVALSAIDEIFSQSVHVRFSYADTDIIHGAKFTDLFGSTPEGILTIDLSRISGYAPASLPVAPDCAQTSASELPSGAEAAPR
jgi:inward rectifier potassium channel